MANTNEIKSKIHPYVRNWLKQRYGIAFGKTRLPLRNCGGFHQFNAVSSDGKIVATIKTASGVTSGGKHPSGKRASAIEQLYYLLLAEADTKLLVIVGLEFFNILKAKLTGVLPASIQLLHCPLPAELASLTRSITNEASEEIDRGKKSFHK